jgi:NADH-quinone oxidoreductase subunit E
LEKKIMSREYIKNKYSPKMENLLLILTGLQQSSPSNFISRADMIWTAEYLNTTLSAVYGVIKYYSMFSTEPRGRFVIRVCQSPICNMLAGGTLADEVESEISTTDGQVTDDGLFSVEAVECLGHCEKAPAMMVNEKVYGNLSIEKVQKILAILKQKSD